MEVKFHLGERVCVCLCSHLHVQLHFVHVRRVRLLLTQMELRVLTYVHAVYTEPFPPPPHTGPPNWKHWGSLL